MLIKENLARSNFKYTDYFVSTAATQEGIVNYPTPDKEQYILGNLMNTADLMQTVRDLLKKPITINSAYRNPQVNKLVKGSATSQHMDGLACDFTCAGFGSPTVIMKYLHSIKLLVDQCFTEGTWVHISRVPEASKNRMMYGYYLLENGDRKFKAI